VPGLAHRESVAPINTAADEKDKEAEGTMLQLDGSPHDWLEGAVARFEFLA
jgi:hypothetical protein